MMDDSEVSAQDIIHLYHLKAEGRARFDWAGIEENIGTPLPRDYKYLSEHCVQGWFRRFIRLSPPSRINANNQRLLDDFEIEQMNMLRELREEGRTSFPYPVYPASGGVLLWGDVRGGGYAFWLTNSDSPSEWTVVIASQRFDHWEHFDGNISRFLAAVAGARYDASGFSDGPFQVTVDVDKNIETGAPPIVLGGRPVFEADPDA